MAPSMASNLGFRQPKEQLTTRQRMLIWQATLKLEVDTITDIVPKIESLLKENNGYMENNDITDEKSAHFRLRIPSENLNPILGSLAQLGIEKYRNISSEEVTDTYIDTQARLNNLKALRDRLKDLLIKAKDVHDILEIEKELTRIQSDIDSQEGILKNLKGRVEFAAIDLYLQKKTVLGPIGYVAKGISWVIMKLFIIQ